MARDYYTLEPDKIYLLGKHFTAGRAGAKIEFITRHHLMMIGEVEDVVDRVWNTRQASAHVVIGPTGRWGQAVYDRDTAWANADLWANRRTIAIEHSNNTGRFGGNDYHDRSWNISDETLIEGARVSAAYCLHEGLGRPNYGTNIRDHNHFTSTGCPVHLQGPWAGNAWGGKAGKYHNQWMEESVWFYDQLDKKLVNPDGTPINWFTTPNKEHNMFGPDQVGALNEAKISSRRAQELLETPISSLINPEHSFSPQDFLRLIDAATWESRKLMEAVARKVGLDPVEVVEQAILKDRGN